MEEEKKQPETPRDLLVDAATRRQCLIVAVVVFTLLGIASFLQPADAGVGTHQQLGLPKCGWVLAADVPCPTCGMTTAWSYTVRGQWHQAFMTQPMGMVLAIGSALVGFLALLTACTGRAFHLYYYKFATSKVFILLCVLAIAAWGFKILVHRGLL